MQWKKHFLYLLLILFPLMVFAQPRVLTGMRIQPGETKSRIIFVLTQKTEGKIRYLPNPDRLIILFNNTQKNFNIANAKLVGSNIKSITTSKTNNNNKVEFILLLTSKVSWTTPE